MSAVLECVILSILQKSDSGFSNDRFGVILIYYRRKTPIFQEYMELYCYCLEMQKDPGEECHKKSREEIR